MNILVVEDEQMIADRLLRMIGTYFNSSDVAINHCDSLGEGLDFVENNTIDLLFLDLNLNGENGFEVLQNVVSHSFQTIIVSAYKAKAIEAFEYGVLDFVAKPFNEERLAKAFQRLSTKSEQGSSTKYLAVQKRGGLQLIAIDDLIYIQGAGIYTELHLKNGTKAIHNKSLDKLQQLLPERFERIHKSYILDMTTSKQFFAASGSKYSVLLQNEEILPIGRTRYKALKEKWMR